MTYRLSPLFANCGQLIHSISQLFIYENKSAIFSTVHDEVYTIGENFYGKLGVEVSFELKTPHKIKSLCNKNVSLIALNYTNGYALTRSGNLYIWGFGGFGLLTKDTFFDDPSPQKISLPARVSSIAFNTHNGHVLVLCDDGNLYSWGRYV